jgi:putative heme transporter
VALIVLVALVLYEELESRLIIPRVYGKTLRLSPVAVTISLLMGGKLFGIIGALLALPIAAAIRATVEELRIDLPGESIERARDARAEARYLEETEGASAVEAANVATTLADELEEEREQAIGKAEIPVEQQRT